MTSRNGERVRDSTVVSSSTESGGTSLVLLADLPQATGVTAVAISEGGEREGKARRGRSSGGNLFDLEEASKLGSELGSTCLWTTPASVASSLAPKPSITKHQALVA